MGVATGCGFKEIYRFPHTTYPYSSCICTFLQQHPYFFVHFVYIYIFYLDFCEKNHVENVLCPALFFLSSCGHLWAEHNVTSLKVSR